MNSSALKAITSSVRDALLTVPGLTSAAIVPAFDDLFVPDESANVQWAARRPDSYPGALLCINRREINTVDSLQTMSYSRIIYSVPLYVSIVATSDGNVDGSAEDLAFQVTEASHLTLIKTTPSGFPANTADYGPLKPDGMHSHPVDATTFATLTRWLVHFQIAA